MHTFEETGYKPEPISSRIFVRCYRHFADAKRAYDQLRVVAGIPDKRMTVVARGLEWREPLPLVALLKLAGGAGAGIGAAVAFVSVDVRAHGYGLAGADDPRRGRGRRGRAARRGRRDGTAPPAGPAWPRPATWSRSSTTSSSRRTTPKLHAQSSKRDNGQPPIIVVYRDGRIGHGPLRRRLRSETTLRR